MISVVMIWIYALTTVFLLGYGFAAISRKMFHYQIESTLSILMAGVAAATVYAQLFSLFAGVSLWANILLLLLCAAVVAVCRSELYSFLKNKWRSVGKQQLIAYVILFFLMAYGTCKGIMHYDTALYHAQSIRWIEEYGIVKGLGNLHCRLAYNSASFALSALYGMRFLTGQSFHVMAGFTALLLAWECVRIGHVRSNKRLLVSDYARIMAIYYLMNIFDEMVSPASDYFMVTTAFYLVIRYLTLLERGEEEPEGYGLLCLLGVYLLTIKLSAALILILVAKPAYLLIRQRKWKSIVAFIACGIGIAVPYLVRNVLISGWLVYPFTFIDLFDVDWKIPRGLAEYDAREIQVWGRGYTDVMQYDMPVREWIGGWFRRQSGMDKLLIAAALAALVIVAVKVVARKKEFLIVEVTLAASFLFWLFSSPLMRYGCVYVFLTAAVVWGDLLESAARKKTVVRKTAYLLLILFGCYKIVMFGKETILSFQNENWVCQKDYDNYPVRQYELDGLVFYCAQEGDQTGYDPFPSSPVRAEMTLRGKGYKDGFRAVEQKRRMEHE